jgi:integrase
MNRGTVKQRGGKNSPWTATADLGVGPDGKRRRQNLSGFKTKREAAEALTKFLADRDAGAPVTPGGKVTLGQFLQEQWIPQLANERRATTVGLYEQNLRAHIIPTLGHIPLKDLTTPRLNAFYGELRLTGRKDGNGGLSPRSIQNVHTILARALRDAVDWHLVPRNVADKARPPRVFPTEKTIWTAEQVTRFLASASEDRLTCLWALAAVTGMRRGELCGLRWRDVNLERGDVKVTQSRVIAAGEVIFAEPKSLRSRRTISIDSGTVAALRTHHARQSADRLTWGETWTDSGLVFTNEVGQPLNPDAVSREFNRLVKASGLPRVTLHALRHSHITMLLTNGVPLHTVSVRAGHASATVTLNVYAHALPGDDRAAAEVAARLLAG